MVNPRMIVFLALTPSDSPHRQSLLYRYTRRLVCNDLCLVTRPAFGVRPFFLVGPKRHKAGKDMANNIHRNALEVLV